MACRSGLASPPTQWSGWLAPLSPSISARATIPCLNSSGNVASEASSTPSARNPFQVKATVTQRLSFSTDARPRPPTAPCRACRRARPARPPAPKREELVPSREGGRAGQQIAGCRRTRACASLHERHCIWSSISENAALSLRAFLISSALTYGYSPYSRKLGRWCSRTNLMNAACSSSSPSGSLRGSRRPS